MDNESYEILSVYHQHANCDSSLDSYSRRFVHGLNLDYLQQQGFPNESKLVADFHCWLNKFNVTRMFANNPAKERRLLGNMRVEDILLPSWLEREKEPYHKVSRRYKQLNIPILNVRCDAYIHNRYVMKSRYVRTCNETEITKLLHGRHCSLYDSYEMYLFYVFQTEYL